MPASNKLLEGLLSLDDDQRWELGSLLADSANVDAIVLSQQLFESSLDEMNEAERAELDAALERSASDAAAGRARPATEVLAELAGRAQSLAVG
jgi:hypothetical protein